MEKKEHIISILVHNKPDVLARIAGILGGKGYNIESLCVNATTQYEISKIVMTTVGSQETVIVLKINCKGSSMSFRLMI